MNLNECFRFVGYASNSDPFRSNQGGLYATKIGRLVTRSAYVSAEKRNPYGHLELIAVELAKLFISAPGASAAPSLLKETVAESHCKGFQFAKVFFKADDSYEHYKKYKLKNDRQILALETNNVANDNE